jgi:hypothetical protein
MDPIGFLVTLIRIAAFSNSSSRWCRLVGRPEASRAWWMSSSGRMLDEGSCHIEKQLLCRVFASRGKGREHQGLDLTVQK